MSCVCVTFEEEIIVRPFRRTPVLELSPGDYVSLFNAKLYKDGLTRRHIKYVSGRFCIYSNKRLGSRIRITDSPTGIHDVNRLLGWIAISDIRRS